MEHFAAETDSPGDGEKSLMMCLARRLSNDNEWSEQVTAGVQLNCFVFGRRVVSKRRRRTRDLDDFTVLVVDVLKVSVEIVEQCTVHPWYWSCMSVLLQTTVR